MLASLASPSPQLIFLLVFILVLLAICILLFLQKELLLRILARLRHMLLQIRNRYGQRAVLQVPEKAPQLEAWAGAGMQNPLLNNRDWLKLVQECVTLFDDLERVSSDMDASRREVASYVCSHLEEILERCGVTVISGDTVFDERRHLPFPATSRVAAGVPIAETLSSGFAVEPRVLRRACVRLTE